MRFFTVRVLPVLAIFALGALSACNPFSQKQKNGEDGKSGNGELEKIEWPPMPELPKLDFVLLSRAEKTQAVLNKLVERVRKDGTLLDIYGFSGIQAMTNALRLVRLTAVPEEGDALLNAIECLLKGDFERAEKEARRAVEASPESGFSIALLAAVLDCRAMATEDAEKWQEADLLYRNAQECLPEMIYKAGGLPFDILTVSGSGTFELYKGPDFSVQVKADMTYRLYSTLQASGTPSREVRCWPSSFTLVKSEKEREIPLDTFMSRSLYAPLYKIEESALPAGKTGENKTGKDEKTSVLCFRMGGKVKKLDLKSFQMVEEMAKLDLEYNVLNPKDGYKPLFDYVRRNEPAHPFVRERDRIAGALRDKATVEVALPLQDGENPLARELALKILAEKKYELDDERIKNLMKDPYLPLRRYGVAAFLSKNRDFEKVLLLAGMESLPMSARKMAEGAAFQARRDFNDYRRIIDFKVRSLFGKNYIEAGMIQRQIAELAHETSGYLVEDLTAEQVAEIQAIWREWWLLNRDKAGEDWSRPKRAEKAISALIDDLKKKDRNRTPGAPRIEWNRIEGVGAEIAPYLLDILFREGEERENIERYLDFMAETGDAMLLPVILNLLNAPSKAEAELGLHLAVRFDMERGLPKEDHVKVLDAIDKRPELVEAAIPFLANAYKNGLIPKERLEKSADLLAGKPLPPENLWLLVFFLVNKIDRPRWKERILGEIHTAKEIQPGVFEAFRLYLQNGYEVEGGVQAVNEALRKGYTPGMCFLTLGLLDPKTPRFDEAKKKLQSLLADESSETFVRLACARALLSMGEIEPLFDVYKILDKIEMKKGGRDMAYIQEALEILQMALAAPIAYPAMAPEAERKKALSAIKEFLDKNRDAVAENLKKPESRLRLQNVPPTYGKVDHQILKD